MVHILDFYYFYRGDVNQYLSMVLHAWESIPSVFDDIGHYIMRCLLTVATRDVDPDTGRGLVQPLDFDASLKTFTEALDRLSDCGKASHLITRMKECIARPGEKEYLSLEFERAISLVWMTVMYLYCRPLRMYFEVGTEVPGGVINEMALCPEFELCGVQESLPVSPVAFLSKYLNSEYALPDGSQDVEVEAASIWLFSWIASCGLPEGGHDA
jgi:hypothetical protein